MTLFILHYSFSSSEQRKVKKRGTLSDIQNHVIIQVVFLLVFHVSQGYLDDGGMYVLERMIVIDDDVTM